jgi:hypothetical protein
LQKSKNCCGVFRGGAAILAKKINEVVSKKIHIIGLKNKTAGHHSKVDNLPPSSEKIINYIIKTLKKS